LLALRSVSAAKNNEGLKRPRIRWLKRINKNVCIRKKLEVELLWCCPVSCKWFLRFFNPLKC
jgi:hypothetical protein